MRSSHVLHVAVLPGISAQVHCWVFPAQICRADPDWLPDRPQVVDAAELQRKESAKEACAHVARERWIGCQNAPEESVDFALAPAMQQLPDPVGALPDFRALVDTGSYPDFGIQGLLQQMDANPHLARFFNYQVSFFWADKELTQFSDIDLSRPACNGLWASVKQRARAIAERSEDTFCDGCKEDLPAMWRHANGDVDVADFPFSAAKADCYLGTMVLSVTELLCVHRCTAVDISGVAHNADAQVHEMLWRKVQLELEGLLFFFDFPLSHLEASGWPLLPLLRKLGAAFRYTFGSVVPNECDLLDGARADELHAHVMAMLEDRAFDPEELRDAAEAATRFLDQRDACPFASGAAMLALLRAVQLSSKLAVQESDFSWMLLDAVKVWDVVSGSRVGAKRRYFYDALTTRWPWLELIERVHAGRGERDVTLWPVDANAFQEDEVIGSCEERVAASMESWSWHWTASPFQAHGKALVEPASEKGLARALCRLSDAEVLFISGTSSGYKWGSFTVRGRQAARGLRQLLSDGPVIRARAWNQNCKTWCDDRRAYGANWSDPVAIVHVKYPCECAMELLSYRTGGARVLHVYDPVDQFAYIPEGMHVILGQTSLAAQDYGNHPYVVANGIQVYWHPLHHSNTDGYEIPWREQASAQSLSLHFLHIDPAARFANTAGLVVSPQHTQEVYKQFGEMDITVMRHSGCMMHLNCTVTRKWFCDRYKTGQRLVNAFAAGLPTVLWNEQGFLDVIAGSDYPAVARSIDEAVHLTKAIALDNKLRWQLRLQARELARPYTLPRLSQRLALILATGLPAEQKRSSFLSARSSLASQPDVEDLVAMQRSMRRGIRREYCLGGLCLVGPLVAFGILLILCVYFARKNCDENLATTLSMLGALHLAMAALSSIGLLWLSCQVGRLVAFRYAAFKLKERGDGDGQMIAEAAAELELRRLTLAKPCAAFWAMLFFLADILLWIYGSRAELL
ncbi:unnamed protein product [Symbiodinium sp. CCMP2592]|nr:unnamed protein product [Symbiodinium sp. CCMP2592]